MKSQMAEEGTENREGEKGNRGGEERDWNPRKGWGEREREPRTLYFTRIVV